jgi:hypothetical protein
VKQKAFDFAMEVVGDINRMAEAFGGGALPDDLMVSSWNDLTAMRYVCFSSFNSNRSMDVLQGHRK